MFFNSKIIIIFLIILVSSPLAILYYKKNRPERAPVKPRPETTITVIPGWNLAQVAGYLVKEGFASSTADVYKFTGYPLSAKKGLVKNLSDLESLPVARDKPDKTSWEGYLAPETFRVYKDASVESIVKKLIVQRDQQISDEMWAALPTGRSFYEVLTLASIVEKEARSAADMEMVADIFWRRLKKNWALQSCATVNYITGKNDPAVSARDKEVDSPYNTYKYPGLPPGPIDNPGLDAIKAVIYSQPSDYWYFLTGDDGVMRYAKTLEEHNANKAKYLR